MAEPLTIRLPDDLSRALDQAAEQMQRERTEIIRLALYQYLGISPEGHKAPAERVRHLIGSLDSGIPDLAENHRAYLLDSLTQKHGR
jgi:metal-responsive CopG/Arc/MetJ family transcriptional regulator